CRERLPAARGNGVRRRGKRGGDRVALNSVCLLVVGGRALVGDVDGVVALDGPPAFVVAVGPGANAAEDGQELEWSPDEAEERRPEEQPAVFAFDEDGGGDHHDLETGGQGQDGEGEAEVADGGEVDEEGVGQGTAEGEENLVEQGPGEADEADPARGSVEHVAGVLGHHLDGAVGPAAALAHDGGDPLRGFGPGHGGGFVGDAPAGGEEGEGEVGVLHQGVGGVAAGVEEGPAAESAGGAGDDGHDVEL